MQQSETNRAINNNISGNSSCGITINIDDAEKSRKTKRTTTPTSRGLQQSSLFERETHKAANGFSNNRHKT
ncbi:unnamed protein product, partial [Ceratitis capitata]